MSGSNPHLTGKRLAFLQHLFVHRDPIAAARHAGYTGTPLRSIVWRLLRDKELRRFAYLLAPPHCRPMLDMAFAAPPYAPATPIKRQSRVAEIVAGANLARVDRELRRHRSAPWLNTLDMVLSRPGRGPNRLGTRKSRRTPPL